MNLLTSIIASLVLSFLLSGLESAILSLSPARLRHLANSGKRQAIILEQLLRKKDQLLASILLLNASANLVAFALITAETVTWLGPWGYLVAFVISLPVYLIWVESLPKSLFKRAPIRLLSFFSPVLVLLHYTVRPLILLLAMPGRWLGKRLGGSPEAPPGSSRAEFRALTEVMERNGTLDPREGRMIRGVLDFQQVRVGEVMLPLSKVTAVSPEMPIDSVISLGRQTGFDQFPVMGNGGAVVGIVNILELLRNHASGGTVNDHRRDLVRSAPDDTAIQVIRRLREAGHQVAAVFNENGRPIGIVSIEDMVGRLTLSGV
ncbi:MAG: DUF21 domain-containing protein [Verrucomicrobiae bacterium]|nr:DUF21 domain-containing protein [Verrucomicrobiae bacterium]